MLDKYEGKPLRSEYVENNNKEKLMMVESLNLFETIDQLIDVYNIADEWCPRFFSVSRGILFLSSKASKELIKQGINRLLGDESIDDDSE